ncbi:ras-like protein [Anaeramoeba flamelloides]|uniref:Ras-like protein n=1 Tax=Anaeramoeba flamelloides TaxID=1746091 RepID=A0AAV8A2I9_9EUKA|nr:ras-like protein [Anaeramoeba flamelloides]KAJ6254876.1 ras-like protein [Anaeramoeba flamelloides]
MNQRIRIVVAGSGGVGKSAITIQFLQGKFVEEYDPSIEDTYRKTIMIDDRSAFLEILDTAGQEEFRKREEIHTKEGDGFLLVFSVISEGSFKQAQKIHQNIIKEKENPNYPIVMMGNKTDLSNENDSISKTVKKYCQEYNTPYFQTSALENLNITEAFHELVRIIWKFKENPNSLKKKKKKKCVIQ